MVLKVAKSSPSLVDLRGTGTTRKKFVLPKKKYIVAYDEIAAYKRRERTYYEDFVNKITTVMLDEFVDYLKKEKCAKKIYMDKEKCCLGDSSLMSLVSPAPSVSIIDDGFSINFSSQTDEGDEFLGKEKSLKHHLSKKPQFRLKSGNSKEGISKDKITERVPEAFKEKKRKKLPVKKYKSVSNPKKKSGQQKIKEVKVQPPKSISEEGINKKSTEDKKTRQVEPTVQSNPFFESDSLDVNVDALFKNGNRYQGRLSCYLMEGEGTYRWSDGTTYQGTFKDGIAGGLGLIKWPDGSWYDGEIKRNKRHGKGVSVLKVNGEAKMCYFGNWKKGKTNGKGMLIYGKGDWYDGYWKNGFHDGFGLRRYPSGSQYLGEWKNGREHGWGTMMWVNGDVYTGYWAKGKMEGKGSYVWRCVKGDGFVHPMQNTFIGNWKNGLRHGSGSLLLANGAMIHSFWENGIKEGPGQIICKNGVVIQSTHLFKADKVYKLDYPIMIPFWNTWYCHFLSNYRSGLFYVQQLEENMAEDETTVKLPQETPDKNNICSNNIPIFAPIESLPLWDIIMKTVCQPIPDLTGETSYVIRPEDVELLTTEEMWLRKVITNRIADITCLYQHYATIACEKKPNFKAYMFRMMLWQMCRDCGIDQTGYSFCELDRETGSDSYPFAVILVFQVIYYLLVLAYELCVKKRLTNESIPGKWGGAFDYFLTNYALPGMQKTTLIPELCNTLPLRDILTIYEDIGIPVTVGKVLNYMLSYSQKPKNKIKSQIYGQNKVYPDGRIIFEASGSSVLGTVFNFQDSDPKYLYFDEIKFLGKRELAWNLFKVCPKAKNGNVPKHEYEVSFLEFCEFIKTCYQKYKDIIDPETEVTIVAKLAKCDYCNKYVEMERHFELVHEPKLKYEDEEEDEHTDSESSNTIEETDCSSLIEDLFNDLAVHEEQNKESYRQSHLNQNDGCPCKDNEFVSIKDNSITKICNCEKTCDCSCNNSYEELEETVSYDFIEKHDSTSTNSSILATCRQFKDAKAITIAACDSDCQCFCHQTPEYRGNRRRLKRSSSEPGISDEEDLNEDLFDDNHYGIKISDAIDYLCGKNSEDAEGDNENDLEINQEDFSEEESTSDGSADISDPDFEEIGDETGEEELSDDNILAGEDLVETAQKFLSDLENVKTLNPNKKMEKIYEKLLQFNCPLFKINYSEFFKNINTKGMSPKELKEGLGLEGPDDLFEEQEVEDIEKELVNESLKVIKLVARQRLYEKLLMEQFRKTICQTETGEYWENFVESSDCNCICKKCLAGECVKRKKLKFTVKDMEYELSSDESLISII